MVSLDWVNTSSETVFPSRSVPSKVTKIADDSSSEGVSSWTGGLLTAPAPGSVSTVLPSVPPKPTIGGYSSGLIAGIGMLPRQGRETHDKIREEEVIQIPEADAAKAVFVHQGVFSLETAGVLKPDLVLPAFCTQPTTMPPTAKLWTTLSS